MDDPLPLLGQNPGEPLHFDDEHTVVEPNNVHWRLIIHINFEDELLMERFVVWVDLLIFLLDFVEFDFQTLHPAVYVERADYHLV